MASVFNGLQKVALRLSFAKQQQKFLLESRVVNSNRKLSTSTSLHSQSDSSSGGTNKSEDRVVMSDDGRVVCCWHPEVPFPYELTQPLPEEIQATDSVLKVQALYPVKEMFRPKPEEMVRQELMNLTYTSKHRWFPKKRRLRYRDMEDSKIQKDREYL